MLNLFYMEKHMEKHLNRNLRQEKKYIFKKKYLNEVEHKLISLGFKVNHDPNIINNIYGDVKIKFLLENNDIFSRKGLDIVYTKTITFKESVCGFSFILKHINGKSYTINNNTGVIINPNYNTSIPKLGFKKSWQK